MSTESGAGYLYRSSIAILERVKHVKEKDERYFAVSPFMIFPESCGGFSIYLRKGTHYLLYTRKGEQFAERHKTVLYENGIEEVYIRTAQKPEYDKYIEDNLAGVLLNESIPMPVRSKIFYHSSTMALREAIQSKLPKPLGLELHKKLINVVRASTKFMCTANALKTLAALMSHDYQTYTHSTNVFIYTLSILETYHLPEEEKVAAGLGALLHDIGKSLIPTPILNKPGKLNNEEWDIVKTHPAKGVGLCSKIMLEQTTISCILFHHERYDGSGYPAGLSGDDIPLPAAVVGTADVYDALTCCRPYAETYTPFKALTMMREVMKGAFDPEVYKRLVLILSGAKII
jgi:putative nucleotidyltransferase with HDIG domain